MEDDLLQSLHGLQDIANGAQRYAESMRPLFQAQEPNHLLLGIGIGIVIALVLGGLLGAFERR